jgi:hypothetical protein
MTADPDEYTTDCAACGHPEDGHGTRYAAGAGDHEYVPETWAPNLSAPVSTGTRTAASPCGWTRPGPHPGAATASPHAPTEGNNHGNKH